jgi:hypothetical protein
LAPIRSFNPYAWIYCRALRCPVVLARLLLIHFYETSGSCARETPRNVFDPYMSETSSTQRGNMRYGARRGMFVVALRDG